MEFKNQIKSIANDIYEKVVRFVYNNNDKDDLLYEYAYLTLSNKMQIMFKFDNATLYVTKPDVQGYNFVFPYEVKINKDEEPLLNEKMNEIQNQQTLTEEEKNNIRKYYEQLNNLTENMIYNIEKTRNSNNYNIEAFEVYSEYMYKKELNKMKESKEEILQSVKIAVDWWAKTICNKTRSGNLGNDTHSKTLMTFSDMIYPKESISSEQITKFKEVLSKKIMDRIYETHDVIKMICDYGPDRLLYDAMKESGINVLRTPFKTNMYIRAYYVAVEEGFSVNDKTLFDSTEKRDIDNVKNIYCAKNEQSKVLKKTF